MNMATANGNRRSKTPRVGKTWSRALVAVVSTSMLWAPVPVFATQTIHCKSDHYRYRYCRVQTDDHVRLERQRSQADCRRGYSWGHDRYGVWVNHGCEADFRVGRGGSDDHRDKALAAGAAVAGIAVIAALAAQSNKGQQSADVPSWAVGTFTGYDPRVGADVELTILPGGSVSGHAGGTSFDGRFADSVLRTERQAFRLERQGNGFVAIDERDANHRVSYRRSGGGY
jgi:Protein of unknown function (DUF3011)